MDDYIDGTLSAIQLSHIQPHLNYCEDCSKVFAQAQSLTAALKDIPVPPAKADYEQRMLAFLEKKQPQKIHVQNWFVAGFGTVIAATLTLWLSFSSPSMFESNVENVNAIDLVVKKEQTVDLIFNLTNELADATLTLELPNNVEIAGFPGKQQLSWNTSFKKGANRLALPIIASGESNGILIARLSTKGTSKVFRIHINTRHTPTSLFMRNSITVTNT